MEITYTSHNFPSGYGSKFHGNNRLEFTVQELMWAAITVGRANVIDILQHGVYSRYEILYRASILFANLALSEGNLYKSSAYEHLDPSEKSAVSYFLGLAFTKLLSNKLLNIPWLLHIDVYRTQFEENGQAFGFGSSRVRPDLIGLDSKQQWVVMEAKGRTNVMENTLLERAKKQTQNLRNIGADEPNLRVAVVTHFVNGRLLVEWEDPEEHNEKSFDIETNKEEYIQSYYKTVFGVLSSDEIEETDGFVSFEFTDINIIIGLDDEIYKKYKEQDYKSINMPEVLPHDVEKPKDKSIEEEDKALKEEGKRDSEDKSLKPKELEEPPEKDNGKYEFFVGNDGIRIGLGENWVNLLKNNKIYKK